MRYRVSEEELAHDHRQGELQSLFDCAEYTCVACREEVIPDNIKIDLDDWPEHVNPLGFLKPVICDWCVKKEGVVDKYDLTDYLEE